MFGFLRSVPVRAFLIGIAAGMRSQTPVAVLAWHHDDAPRHARWRRWPILRSVWGRRVLTLAWGGEVLGDKSPMAPPRTQPGPLFGRVLFGGIAGAAIGSERRGKGSIAMGFVIGAIGSAIGSFGGMHTRAAMVEATGLPDPTIAVVEDIAALSIARRAVTKR